MKNKIQKEHRAAKCYFYFDLALCFANCTDETRSIQAFFYIFVRSKRQDLGAIYPPHTVIMTWIHYRKYNKEKDGMTNPTSVQRLLQLIITLRGCLNYGFRHSWAWLVQIPTTFNWKCKSVIVSSVWPTTSHINLHTVGWVSSWY